jgi:hypothetical protein
MTEHPVTFDHPSIVLIGDELTNHLLKMCPAVCEWGIRLTRIEDYFEFFNEFSECHLSRAGWSVGSDRPHETAGPDERQQHSANIRELFIVFGFTALRIVAAWWWYISAMPNLTDGNDSTYIRFDFPIIDGDIYLSDVQMISILKFEFTLVIPLCVNTSTSIFAPATQGLE